MKIATFNVNSLRTRLPILEQWLPEADIDILAVQETKVQDHEFPLEDIERLGYNAAFRGQKTYNGVAILSRKKPDEIIHGFTDGTDPSWDTRVIAARFNNLWILNTYVIQGKSIDHPDYETKKDFLRRTAEMIKKLKENGAEVLWTGDMNVAPTELDVSNAKTKKKHVCFVEELRNLFTSLINETGLTDVFRTFHPNEALYSFFDYRVKNALDRNIGWRIDHMLATPGLAAKCTGCNIDTNPRRAERPSDHTPMILTVRD